MVEGEKIPSCSLLCIIRDKNRSEKSEEFFLTQMGTSTELDEVYQGKEPAAVRFKFH